MKTLFLFTAVLGFATAPAFAQSYTNLSVSGTASINNLDVYGNSATFGAWTGDSSEPGASFVYSDGTSGTNASLTTFLTRPASSWVWQRGGASSGAMVLTSSNQLLLTGTQSSAPGSIIIDPTAGQITVNGNPVVTTGATGLIINDNEAIGYSTPFQGNLLVNSSNAGAPGGAIWIANESGDHPGNSARLAFTLDGSTDSTPNASIDSILISSNGSSDMTFSTSLASTLYERMRITSSGNIGINTSTPASDKWLTVGGGYSFVSTVQLNTAFDQDTINKHGVVMAYDTDDQIGVVIGDSNGNPSNLAFWTYSGSNWSEQMRIDPNGNVGIQTTAPEYTFDVNGTARINGTLTISGSSNVILINPAGDLSMGTFTNGTPPPDDDYEGDGGGGDSDAMRAPGFHPPGIAAGSGTTSGTSSF